MTIKQKYKFVKWVMEECNEFDLKKRLDIIAPIKKEIRQCMKPLNTDPFEETYHYKDEYGESYYIKEFFDEHFTDEDKKEFIESQWRNIYSTYDCTGKSFTTSIRIFNLKEPNSFGAKSVVYHFLSLDV